MVDTLKCIKERGSITIRGLDDHSSVLSVLILPQWCMFKIILRSVMVLSLEISTVKLC